MAKDTNTGPDPAQVDKWTGHASDYTLIGSPDKETSYWIQLPTGDPVMVTKAIWDTYNGIKSPAVG